MIISASRRTDIPAFYGEWLLRCLQAGEVLVCNPVQPKQVRRVSLALQDVDALVFWTKNPGPFLRLLPDIDAMGYPSLFHFTLNPYDQMLEPGVPGVAERIATFRKLSSLVGRDRLVWRYDPVLLAGDMDAAWHAAAFRRLADALSASTSRCVISFLTDYRKIRRRMCDVRHVVPGREVICDLAGGFARTARESGIGVYACCCDTDLSSSAIMPARCIDPDLIGRISTSPLRNTRKDRGQRKACGCIESRDIGVYDTCMHGCLYCYAVSDHDLAVSRAVTGTIPVLPCSHDNRCGNDATGACFGKNRAYPDLFHSGSSPD
ncbi:MAG: DUF1848 domain-containing protein [Chlorobi bacterium]|nr:DUF1848 domain-containing protein [Chlorobiota bacterium]